MGKMRVFVFTGFVDLIPAGTHIGAIAFSAFSVGGRFLQQMLVGSRSDVCEVCKDQ